MPEMTIQLRRNPVTGKRDILVKLEEDPSALPHEHENLHRALVNKLIEGGLARAEDIGVIAVKRGEGEVSVLPPLADPEPRERRADAAGH